jgi:two-component system, cell cycle sensor histidine kinase and response regulator CckA
MEADLRIEAILELLMRLAAGDLHARVEHSGTGDELDAIIESINMLAEELAASTISRGFLENVLRSMVDMLVVCNPDQSIRLVNDAVCRALLYTPEELIGSPVEKIDPAALAHGEPSITGLMSELAASGEDQERELDLLRKDGARLPVMIKCSVARDARGRLEAIIIAARDLSERRQAEQEKIGLSRRLESQKLEAIGNLAGGVAHDINNMLTGIIGLASVLQDDIGGEDPMRADVESILTACYRGRDLTRNLLGFARRGNYRREKLSLNCCVQEVQRLLERTISKKITIKTELAADLVAVEGDPSQINHLLINLALNAVDAMPGYGELTFTTESSVIEASPTSSGHEMKPGRYARLTVADTGVGMDAETIQRAFEPFFTTKPPGRGTGLGLSMVHGTVKSHGGEVILESRTGQGTTVTVLLPAMETPRDTAPASAATRPGFHGSGTVLFVDDEEIVRKNGKRLLEKLGYRVLLAEDGVGALDLYRGQMEGIVLVILDLSMPVLDGEECFNRLKEMNPRASVLLSSGHTKEQMADRLIRLGAVGFLQKPYDLNDLAAELEKALRPRTQTSR